jgi:hypothetical protein
MINTILWSKNRAAQLDLTLNTYKKYFKDWREQKLNVIYTFSNTFFEQGYNIVKKHHPEFNWVRETNFRQDTLNCYNNADEKYTSFLVDDDVFVDSFSLDDKEFKEFDSSEDVACLSCRIAPYVNFCYTQNQPQPQPQFVSKNKWNWLNAVHDWGYPFSVASFHIFRKSDLSFINNMPFTFANTFEGNMDKAKLFHRPYMLCYDHSKCICTTNNRVQSENANRFENTDPIDQLNMYFVMGKRLNTEVNNYATINMCHGPLKYIWS